MQMEFRNLFVDAGESIIVEAAIFISFMYVSIVYICFSINDTRFSILGLKRIYTHLIIFVFVFIGIFATLALIDGTHLEFNIIYILSVVISSAIVVRLIRRTGGMRNSTLTPAFFLIVPILIFMRSPGWFIVVMVIFVLFFFVKDGLYPGEEMESISFRLIAVTVMCFLFGSGVGIYAQSNLRSDIEEIQNEALDVSKTEVHSESGNESLPTSKQELVVDRNQNGEIMNIFVREMPGIASRKTGRKLGTGERVWGGEVIQLEGEKLKWIEIFEKEADIKHIGFARYDLFRVP